jgi:uncharacterized membrane protein YedE/YeeE
MNGAGAEMLNLNLSQLKHPWLMAVTGGVLIGCASSLMMVFNGRIAGLSGIIARSMIHPIRAESWRWAFLIGLLLGGLVLLWLIPQSIGEPPHFGKVLFIFAGLLVGFGTRLAGGCTSGHGICGVSRLSIRSIAATITFLFFGILTASLLRRWGLL